MLANMGLGDDDEDDVVVPLTLHTRVEPEENYFYTEQAGDENAEGHVDEQEDAQVEDYGDQGGEEEDAYEEDDMFRAERNVAERVSYGGDEMGPIEGQNPRMFYAIRNQNRSEEDQFLDRYEKFCYQHVPKIDFHRQNHPFTRLLYNHPHPKFLNVALCYDILDFYNPQTRTYQWNTKLYKDRFKDRHEAHDVYRYIELFNQYI